MEEQTLFDPDGPAALRPDGERSESGPGDRRGGTSPTRTTPRSNPPAAPESGTRAEREPLGRNFAPGTRIQQYELIRQLGRGGMGTVFLARDIKLGRRVAIKIVSRRSRRSIKRFLREARATARCSHENIVVIHEVGVFAEHPFMVLEYLDGQTLRSRFDGQSVPPHHAVELMVPVVRALTCAHAHNLVHRDLKPDNIVLTAGGTVKVLDFGIAKLVAGDDDGDGPASDQLGPGLDQVTRANAIVGTPRYMAPEQWTGGAIDARTDIWAVGIMLYELISGRHPLTPMTARAALESAREVDRALPSIRTHVAGLEAELADVIDHCLVKRRDQRLSSARDLLAGLERFLPGRSASSLEDDASPYAGLTAFQESEAGRFFGRSRDIARGLTRLRERPLLAVVGPSGAGKSSFVRAGLVPALKRSGERWEARIIRPGRSPLAALTALLESHAADLPTQDRTPEPADSAHRRLGDTLREQPGLLGEVLRRRARRTGARIVLFVDQFEELYTLVADPAERRTFLACLSGVSDDPEGPLRAVLSMRSDFLDHAADTPGFMDEITRGLMFLPPLSESGLREALTRPAALAGYRFESGEMVTEIVAALVSGPGALPLLQFAASKLWDSRDTSRRMLTRAGYEAMGGIAGALAGHADAVMAALSPQDRTLARKVFLRLVTHERTRAIVDVTDLTGLGESPRQVERLLEHLVMERLLVAQTEGGTATVEVVHESLIDAWPTLRRWLDDDHEDAAFRAQLTTAAEQWHGKGRPHGLLWRGEAVVEARRFARRHRDEVPARARDYLDAVLTHADRATRRRRYAVIAVMVFLVGLVAAAAVALVSIRNAERAARAEAERARAAEAEVSKQLTLIRQKEREKRSAERKARTAAEKADEASAEVAQSKEELAEANIQLRQALHKAKKARDEAEAEAEKARRAETELRRELDEKQRRIERLKKKVGNVEDRLR